MNCLKSIYVSGSYVVVAVMLLILRLEASEPSIQESILRAPAMDFPIIHVGTNSPSDSDSILLWQALEQLRIHGPREGIPIIDSWLIQHSESPWAPSIRNNLAEYYRFRGRYTLALQYWNQNWNALKSSEDPTSRRIADRSLVSWASLLAVLGRLEELIPLVAEGKKRNFAEIALRTSWDQTLDGLTTMTQFPGRGFRCGTYALNSVGNALFGNKFDSRKLVNLPSPASGFCMSALVELSDEMKMDLVAVERRSSSKVVVPSIIHWNQKHYAAIVAQKGDYYEILDPTFGNGRWIPIEYINQEASGYFMIPRSQLSSDWNEIGKQVTDKIFGKGGGNSTDSGQQGPCGDSSKPSDANLKVDPDDCCDPGANGGAGGGGPGTFQPGGGSSGGGGASGGWGGDGPDFIVGEACPGCNDYIGMPRWRVTEPYMNLWIDDEPLAYQPAIGQRISFKVSFKQRNTRDTSGGFDPFGGWESPWVSWINTQPKTNNFMPDFMCDLYAPGGGVRHYDVADYVNQPDSNTRMETILSADNNFIEKFIVHHKGGAREIYGFSVTNYYGGGKFFMTEKVDQYGHTNSIHYDAGTLHITEIVDGDGKTNLFTYTGAHVTQITDPYGRSCSFGYSPDYLYTITDAVGLTSYLTFSDPMFPTVLTTPYGTNSFSYVGTSGSFLSGTNIGRAVIATFPNGAKEMYAYRDDSAPYLPNAFDSSLVPTNSPIGTLDNAYMNYRNSFYWDRRHFSSLSTNDYTKFTTNDYNKARLRHWLHAKSLGSTSRLGKTLSMEREAAADQAGNVPGQMVWFDYYYKPYSYQEGDSFLLGALVQLLPDGSTKFEWFQRKNTSTDYGEITNSVSTYSLNGVSYTRSKAVEYGSASAFPTAIYGYDGELVYGADYSNNRPLHITNAVGEVTSYLYDNNGRVTSIKTPAGLTTTNIFGADGYISQSIALEIHATNNFVRSQSLISSFQDSKGLSVTNTYDGLRRLTSRWFPDGSFISNKYTYLDRTAFKNRAGDWTYFSYDQNRQVVAVTNNLGDVTTFARCICGALDSVTDALTNSTTLDHDLNGRLVAIRYPSGTIYSNQYDALGRVVKQVDQTGRWVSTSYNNQGLVAVVSNNFGLVISNQYSIHDFVTNVIAGSGISFTNTFDDLGRVTKCSYNDGNSYQVGYFTNYIVATNRAGKITGYGFDAALRLTSFTNEAQLVVKLARASFGMITNLTNEKGQHTTWEYNIYGEPIRKSDTLGNLMWTNSYDNMHNATNFWTPEKGNIVFKYDANGNRTNVLHSHSPSVSYIYNRLGRIIQMEDGIGITKFEYDSSGLLISEDGPWLSDSVKFGIIDNNRASLSISSPSGSPWIQTYSYDVLGRLTNTISSAGSFDYTYLTNSGPTQLVRSLGYPSGMMMTNGYNSMLQTTIRDLKKSGTTLDSTAYSFDRGLQLTNSIRRDGAYVNYAYDLTGQITNALAYDIGGSSRKNEQFSYGFDEAGNLTNLTRYTSSLGIGVNGLNQITNISRGSTILVAGSASPSAGSVTINGASIGLNSDKSFGETFSVLSTYTAIAFDPVYGRFATNTVSVSIPSTQTCVYDSNGNLIADGSLGYEYDDENQLSIVTSTNSWKSEFLYDGLGRRRVQREYSWANGSWVLTNVTGFVYSREQVVQERDGNNLPRVTYTRGLDIRSSFGTAGGIGGLLARTVHNPESHSFYHSDRMGNVVGLFGPAGEELFHSTYDPFGNPIAMSGSLVQPYGFSSKEVHSNSGLVYYGHRYYSPILQRWLTRDQIQERDNINLYTFVNNRSLNEFDPLGNWGSGLEVTGMAGGGLGGTSGLGTASAGVGMFVGPNPAGSQGSLGGFYGGGATKNDPCPKTKASAGQGWSAGIGAFITSADNAEDMAKTDKTLVINVGFGVDLGVNISWGGGVVTVDVSGGLGNGINVGIVPSYGGGGTLKPRSTF